MICFVFEQGSFIQERCVNFLESDLLARFLSEGLVGGEALLHKLLVIPNHAGGNSLHVDLYSGI